MKIHIIYLLLFLRIDVTPNHYAPAWGFYSHKQINRLAVFTLPPPLIKFYKSNLDYIVEKSVNPDKRRYTVDWEGPRHFFDTEAYPDTLLANMPTSWLDVKDSFDSTFFTENGVLPWNLSQTRYLLTQAFTDHDQSKILRYSADAGHYLADANVPLHTTKNYNGQYTDQYGIHGFWETRLPELFSNQYQLTTGRASYLLHPDSTIWQHVQAANLALDSVFSFEKIAQAKIKTDKKYSFEKRGNSMIKTYSYEYSKLYHQMLNGMIERQMKRSIKLIGDFWYTCWVDAGMPDL